MDPFKKMIEISLLEKRKLTPSTTKTYVALLNALINRLDIVKDVKSFTTESKQILEHIKTIEKPQTRKTILSALFVLTGLEKYSERMKEDIKIVNDIYGTKTISKERKDKHLNIEDIKKINDKILQTYKKDKTQENLTNVLISVLMSGEYIAPRRLEWAFVKLKNYNTDEDNYIHGNKAQFNIYKTKRIYGKQFINLPPEIMKWIKKLKQDKDREYVLLNNKNKPFSPSLLSKRLNELYGIGIDMIRSTYINDVVYKNEAYLKIVEASKNMGNSISAQQKYYIKTS